ncbi:MAG: signal recognition particle-docking protein FtsY [Candidatus Diapherotrites archaeon]|nr:signal recognition particle-docking protein FtsY [Candidatus Diapherotrites archaeon]
MFDFFKKKIEKFTKKVSNESTSDLESIEKPADFTTESKNEIKEVEPTITEIDSVTQAEELQSSKTILEPTKPINQDVEKPLESDSTKSKFSLNTFSKIKQTMFGNIKVKKDDFEDALFELELGLIESDVSLDCAQEINRKIGEHLEGLEIKRGENIQHKIKQEIKNVLLETLEGSEFDLIEEIKNASNNEKPITVLFVGPNGVGKTTTIAKIAKLLKDNSITTILCAADTFRAAAIQQLEEHSKNLNIKLIKHDYGADPAAVVFDAVKSAEAKKVNSVLIDTAGRQPTSHNLMQELEKIVKTAKPNFTVFVGESMSGHGIIDQINTFKKISNVNAVILTKLDTDVKGGTALSIYHSSKVPIAFFGTGQELNNLTKFNSYEFTKNLVGE